jgi:hypothetical protein
MVRSVLVLATAARITAHWDVGERRDGERHSEAPDKPCAAQPWLKDAALFAGLEEWRHPHRKRCDMFATVFRGPNGPPAYTEGEWVASTEERRSVTSSVPMECVEETPTACPVGGCQQRGAATPSGYCDRFYGSCYRHRQSATFTQHLHNLVRRNGLAQPTGAQRSAMH